MVRQVLSSLEAHDVFLVDVSPSNVAFLDESGNFDLVESRPR